LDAPEGRRVPHREEVRKQRIVDGIVVGFALAVGRIVQLRHEVRANPVHEHRPVTDGKQDLPVLACEPAIVGRVLTASTAIRSTVFLCTSSLSRPAWRNWASTWDWGVHLM
jgi:hypothetical protein